MKWLIASIGRPRLAYARLGIDDYRTRLRRHADMELLAIRAGTAAEEGRALLERTADCHRIVLDERGERLGSMEFARLVDKLQQDRTVRRVAVLVGGADGHSEAVRAAADRVISLSPMTLQHELALVVLLEQIYRAYSILGGAPYHRE